MWYQNAWQWLVNARWNILFVLQCWSVVEEVKRSEQQAGGSAERNSTALKWDSALRMETWHHKPFECCVYTSSGSRASLSSHYNFIALTTCFSHPFAFTIIHGSSFWLLFRFRAWLWQQTEGKNGEGLGPRLANNCAWFPQHRCTLALELACMITDKNSWNITYLGLLHLLIAWRFCT